MRKIRIEELIGEFPIRGLSLYDFIYNKKILDSLDGSNQTLANHPSHPARYETLQRPHRPSLVLPLLAHKYTTIIIIINRLSF